MSTAVRRIEHVVAVLVGLSFLLFGAAKFTGRGPSFKYIEYQSGFEWVDPLLTYATGVCEVAAGVLLLIPASRAPWARLAGSALVVAIMIGAFALHLSPWLGVSTPTGTVDGAAAPWTASDFVSQRSSRQFVLSIVFAALGAWLLARISLHRPGPDTTRSN
ncbi:MAG: DoxX family protein [Actinomycetota bacterium]